MEPQADPSQNAFVLRTAPSSDSGTCKLEGRVQHVDNGRELKFRSVKALVIFVSQRTTDNRGKCGRKDL